MTSVFKCVSVPKGMCKRAILLWKPIKDVLIHLKQLLLAELVVCMSLKAKTCLPHLSRSNYSRLRFAGHVLSFTSATAAH